MRIALFTLLMALTPCFATQARAEIVSGDLIDRILQREDVHNVVIDDKNSRVFFEKVRGKTTMRESLPHDNPMTVASALKSIYVVSLYSDSKAKLLFKHEDGVGYYFASADPWSPDRRYLTVFSYQNGQAQPGVFDLNTSTVRFFDIVAQYDPLRSSLVWTSNNEITFLSPNNGRNAWDYHVYAARDRALAREKAWVGRAVSAEVIGAGRYGHWSGFELSRLVKINIDTGAVESLGDISSGSLTYSNGPGREIIIEERVLDTEEVRAKAMPHAHKSLSIFSPINRQRSAISGLSDFSTRLKLLSDSGNYAVVEAVPKKRAKGARETLTFIVDIAAKEIVGRISPLPKSLAWVGDKLVYEPGNDNSDGDTDFSQNEIAMRIDSPSPVAASATHYYYLEGGDLWSAGLNDIRENLSARFDHDLGFCPRLHRSRFLQPTRSSTDAHTPALNELYLCAKINDTRNLIMFSEGSSEPKLIPYPDSNAILLGSANEGAVFLSNSYGTGSQLHYVEASIGGHGTEALLYSFNEHLSGVSVAAEPIRIEHVGFDGKKVTSWLYLPESESPDQKGEYPLVVIQYAGKEYTDQSPPKSGYLGSIWDLHLSTITKMEVYVSEGYAVLLASIPLGPVGEAGEPMMRMMPAIMSAVDSAVETGFADENRMALVGQSYGGYGALSVAVQTDRFQAIIAMSSISNLFTHYGEFPPVGRVNAAEVNKTIGAAAETIENGQARMGAPPWLDPDRYLRNSPIFEIDRVQTPLMLIHGELDSASVLSHAEEVFTALHRDAKDVLFVKYFGEQHIIEQPQNQRDMWRRVFAFLRDSGVTPGPKELK